MERGYDRVNREAIWQVLRKYDVGGKQLNGIKSKYINSEWFRIKMVWEGVYHAPLTFH